ncbi:hypothetical protein [Mycolicibacterium sp. J2]|uniref:hypothetical protein n=1 Tax=Mycolicibacterium sp. J2 TaxID=2993511 RepID=UPI00224A7CDE|nr:hypothetical protein [Mycolicibacterium sp. J2]MCX2714373.1 hypothetical protein [Mycolicibacterium sp. J2]
MNPPNARAHWLRGGLVGGSSAVLATSAHTGAAGALPHGAALVAALLVCATAGAAVGAVDLRSRHARAVAVFAALCAAQFLSHVTLAVTGGHHHAGAAMGLTPAMIAAHTGAAVVLGMSIAVVEHLYTVCATLLTWLRLFAVSTPRPTSPTVRWAEPVVIRPVLLRPGLGMRAPPFAAVPTA